MERKLVGQTAAVCLIVALTAQPLSAQTTHRGHAHHAVQTPSAGPHGGSLRQADGIQVETLVTRGGIQLFVYDSEGNPITVDSGRGAASIHFDGGAKRYRYDLLPDGKGALVAPVSLSKLAGRQIELDVQLVGISAAKGRLAYHETASVPQDNGQQDNAQRFANSAKVAAARFEITVSSATAADAGLIKRQAKCPVMDEPLGSMGNPIKVMVGDKPIFLCCKGCIKKIQAEPAKYLAIVYGDAAAKEMDSRDIASRPIAPSGVDQVREGVFKVSDADAPFIAQQKRCPVMDEPLDAMGGPYKVNAEGRAIYICCPGCAKSIAKEPHKYLDLLAEQGVDAPILR